MDENLKEKTEKLWTVQDVSEFLQLKPFTVRAMVRERRLPAITEGKRLIRFDPNEIKKSWVDQHRRRVR